MIIKDIIFNFYNYFYGYYIRKWKYRSTFKPWKGKKSKKYQEIDSKVLRKIYNKCKSERIKYLNTLGTYKGEEK